MRTFTDSKGRQWPIEVNVGTIMQTRSLCDIDLLDLDAKYAIRMQTDPILVADIAYGLCKPDISKDEWLAAMDGSAIGGALVAVVQEMVDFFQKYRPSMGSILSEAVTRTVEAQEKIFAMAREKTSRSIDAITKEAEQELARPLLGRSSGDVLASVE